ncbi:MAG: putative DNA-binding domain-containing protein, partial [Thiotrichaceae bacterium]|nr:putative DNA-binding domain-containing protein [Thiotrichaceae bacterium]
GKSEDFENDIISTEDALAEHRLGAYYNAYRIRLIDSLATDFECLQKEIGDEGFELMILDYLKHYPSENPSVRWVGTHMVEFLKHSEHPDKKFLTELAEFEWSQGLCFDAGDSKQIFRLEDMAQIAPESWPQLTFQFHDSVRWLDLHSNAAPYWVALDNNEELPEKHHEEIPTRWLMWRKGMSPNWRSLEVAEAWAIEAAYNGANFAELCEGLLEWIGEDLVAMTAAGFLKQWIHEELITGINS